MNDRNYTVQTKIARPVSEVFEAVIDDRQLARYFVDKASGPLREGQEIVWHWGQWGDYPVIVKRIVRNERIELELDTVAWKKLTTGSYPVMVIMEFESLSETTTMISISEAGWLHDEPGYKASHENCGGWTHMSICLKAYLEHAIDLR
ncbi:MAG: SRPBCC domain-containing protein [Pirellula sp.]